MATTLPAMVDPTLARHLRTAAEKAAHWTKERDRLIVEAVRSGGTLREVGAFASLTHTAIAKIERRAAGGFSTKGETQ